MGVMGTSLKAVVRWTTKGDGVRPEQAYEGDAGYDLYVTRSVEIDVGQTIDLEHDLRMELPQGHWAMIVGRSSTMRARSLMVNMAIIDNGYRGDFYTSVTNLGQEVHLVQRGERVSQLIFVPLVAVRFRLGELKDSDRGKKGFGSSGRF